MALEDILEAIRREADAEAQRIEQDGAREASDVLERGLGAAGTLQFELSRSRDDDARLDAQRVVQAARADASRLERMVREDVFCAAVDRARELLAEFRGHPAYREFFLSLLAEGLALLPDAEVVRVDPRDAPLAAKALAESGSAARVKASLDTWGGVELATVAACVRNTLEARLERADPYLRRLMASSVPPFSAR